jgi:hypothetical protein
MKIFATYSLSFFSGAKTFKITRGYWCVIEELKHNFSLIHTIERDLKERFTLIPF